jgi:hypothetical protein
MLIAISALAGTASAPAQWEGGGPGLPAFAGFRLGMNYAQANAAIVSNRDIRELRRFDESVGFRVMVGEDDFWATLLFQNGTLENLVFSTQHQFDEEIGGFRCWSWLERLTAQVRKQLGEVSMEHSDDRAKVRKWSAPGGYSLSLSGVEDDAADRCVSIIAMRHDQPITAN